MPKVAITAFVDGISHFVDEANQMTLSGIDLNEQFTFVLFVEPSIVTKIKKRHNVIIYPYSSKNDSYYSNYRYAKSLEFLESNKNVLSKYDYLIKTDTDVFFTTHLNTHVFDNKIYFGKGYFNGWAKDEMECLAYSFKCKNYKHGFEPHSTVMGPSKDVINFMIATDKMCRKVFEFLCPDGDWNSQVGVWGKSLYSGTSTLIAQDLVLFEMFDENRIAIINKLDAPCTYGDNLDLIYHIAQWHTREMYSKFAAREGEYDLLNYAKDSSVPSYCLNIYLKNKREVYE